MAPATKAQQKAVAKYSQKSYDHFQLRIPKGQREEIKVHAGRTGESMNAFLLRAIKETMQRDIDKSDKRIKEGTP